MLKSAGKVFLLFVFVFIANFAFSQKIKLESIDNFTIKDISENKITIGFTAKIENKTGKNIKVAIKDGKLYKNDKYVGAFKLLEKYKVPKHSKGEIPVQAVVETEGKLGLLKDGLAMLMGSSIDIKATGIVKGSWFVFWKNLPFEVEEQVSLSDIMGL